MSPPGRPAAVSSTSAERPAPNKSGVYLRTFDGDDCRRISVQLAEELVSAGVADRVSAAGHIRLKLGVRSIQHLAVAHGIPVVERSRMLFGDSITARELRHKDKAPGLRWQRPIQR